MSQPIMNEHQPSLSEWFRLVGSGLDPDALQNEDNTRAKRIEILNDVIGMPYDKPVIFPARELVERSASFKKLLEERGEALCAIRLVPTRPDLPKLRNRGLPLRRCYEEWFLKQDIDPDAYIAEVYEHWDVNVWGMIFVMNEKGVFGEIVAGNHDQLTQGNMIERPIQFSWDFENWVWSREDKGAEEAVKQALEGIRVPPEKESILQEKVGARFSYGYLVGYFEAIVPPSGVLFFIDYNRLLSDVLTPFPIAHERTDGGVRGSIAHPGVVLGRVVVVLPDQIPSIDFAEGSILVCENTDVRFVPLMRRAGAIITDRGAMLSHAAIVAREFKKPCIVSTWNATEVLKTGDEVEVDANTGVIRRI